MQPCYLYTHLHHKIGNVLVTRSEQPTRRWQLPSALRLQLRCNESPQFAHGAVTMLGICFGRLRFARGSSAAHWFVMNSGLGSTADHSFWNLHLGRLRLTWLRMWLQ